MVLGMYTLQKAAAVLGIAEGTVRGWMKQLDIKGTLIETDKRRRYITRSDMITLIDHMYQKRAKKEKKKEKQKIADKPILQGSDSDKYSPDHTCENFYPLVGAASLLGVTINTVQNWIKQDNIEKKVISTDRKRVYISHTDILRLADLHGREISLKAHTDPFPQKEADTVTRDMDRLYSIKEAALCLNASQNALRAWIKQANIEKTKRTTDRKRACITYKVILKLADLHRRELVIDPSPTDIVKEVKEIKQQLKKHATVIEDIIHDLRIYVSRSIYVGD
jgi:DNA-binding transcriptional MerR regulator